VAQKRKFENQELSIAVYSLTRDRFQFTEECFCSLWNEAGIDFDHFVVDNGSQDGTQGWLLGHAAAGTLKAAILNETNKGISYGSNQALDRIFSEPIQYDLICKVDNDCLVKTPDILRKIHDLYRDCLCGPIPYITSPRVEGINRQPSRGRTEYRGEYGIGLTAIVGGLFHVVPRDAYKNFRYDQTLPLAKYQDDQFCNYVKTVLHGQVGYIEELVVEHYLTTNGQAALLPEYFARKYKEEQTPLRTGDTA
jgi:glycosyltransferase involved in cell wall biosynthesis